MTTTDEIIEWWDVASNEERTKFLDALVEEMGFDEFYLMLETAFGEEELQQAVLENARKRSLS